MASWTQSIRQSTVRDHSGLYTMTWQSQGAMSPIGHNVSTVSVLQPGKTTSLLMKSYIIAVHNEVSPFHLIFCHKILIFGIRYRKKAHKRQEKRRVIYILANVYFTRPFKLHRGHTVSVIKLYRDRAMWHGWPTLSVFIKTSEQEYTGLCKMKRREELAARNVARPSAISLWQSNKLDLWTAFYIYSVLWTTVNCNIIYFYQAGLARYDMFPASITGPASFAVSVSDITSAWPSLTLQLSAGPLWPAPTLTDPCCPLPQIAFVIQLSQYCYMWAVAELWTATMPFAA